LRPPIAWVLSARRTTSSVGSRIRVAEHGSGPPRGHGPGAAHVSIHDSRHCLPHPVGSRGPVVLRRATLAMPCHEFSRRGQRPSTRPEPGHGSSARPAASSRSRRRRTIERHPRGPQCQGRRPLGSWGIHGGVQQASLPGCCQAPPHGRGTSRQRPAGLPSYAHRRDPASTVADHGKRDPNNDQPVPPYRVRWRWWRGPGRAGRPGTGRRPATRRLPPTAICVTGVGQVAGTGVGGDGEQRDQHPDLPDRRGCPGVARPAPGRWITASTSVAVRSV
jgi:hypothetical protein